MVCSVCLYLSIKESDPVPFKFRRGVYGGRFIPPVGGSGAAVVFYFRTIICSPGSCILMLFKVIFRGKLKN